MVGGGGVVSNPEHPVLITEAEPSYEDQLAARKRKYAIMMGSRIPCLLLAMVFYDTWWLALAFIVLSIPLPWMAVLIANDRPPRKSEKASRHTAQGHDAERRALEARPRHVIDG
ncbi:DUF3099 domain-containing protein [Actinosynnema pretiosum subsp. pretiosum]|uniref:DUF3099 domain-containing protein n=1 Tax=Actinosynnema pretiosum subsp. pretiosum TaxID=103721 RepID=A0AA45R6B9_9PSEU|nr:DUF3099 domain-containing protein [Actinosynnema pretiosum subsp. pretiosum]